MVSQHGFDLHFPNEVEGFLDSSVGKESTCNAGDPGSIPGSGKIYWRRDRLLLLLLSHFSRVPLCATPQTAAHQAPLSLGFSRQEHWSEVPFPPPMHESENEVTQSCLATIPEITGGIIKMCHAVLSCSVVSSSL